MIQCFENFNAEESLAGNMHRAFTRSRKQIITRTRIIIIKNLREHSCNFSIFCYDLEDEKYQIKGQ